MSVEVMPGDGLGHDPIPRYLKEARLAISDCSKLAVAIEQKGVVEGIQDLDSIRRRHSNNPKPALQFVNDVDP